MVAGGCREGVGGVARCTWGPGTAGVDCRDGLGNLRGGGAIGGE